MDLIWGRAVASTDAWVGGLDGAVVTRVGNRVTHLIVKRGLILTRRFAVPFEHVGRRDSEALYLSLSISEVLKSPSASDISDQQSTEALTPRTALVLSDGLRMRLRGMRVSRDTSSVTRLVAGRGGLGWRRLLLPVEALAELGSKEITVAAGRSDLDGFPTYRLDHDIETELWEALYASEDVSDLDVQGIRLWVLDGVATLEGNVRNSSARADAERVARSTDGVAAVDDRVVVDWDLELAVASYISRTAPQLLPDLVVHAHLGVVRLEGRDSSRETKDAVIQGIRSIPGVREIKDLVAVRLPSDEAGEGSQAPPPAAADEPQAGPSRQAETGA